MVCVAAGREVGLPPVLQDKGSQRGPVIVLKGGNFIVQVGRREPRLVPAPADQQSPAYCALRSLGDKSVQLGLLRLFQEAGRLLYAVPHQERRLVLEILQYPLPLLRARHVGEVQPGHGGPDFVDYSLQPRAHLESGVKHPAGAGGGLLEPASQAQRQFGLARTHVARHQHHRLLPEHCFQFAQIASPPHQSKRAVYGQVLIRPGVLLRLQGRRERVGLVYFYGNGRVISGLVYRWHSPVPEHRVARQAWPLWIVHQDPSC